MARNFAKGGGGVDVRRGAGSIRHISAPGCYDFLKIASSDHALILILPAQPAVNKIESNRFVHFLRRGFCPCPPTCQTMTDFRLAMPLSFRRMHRAGCPFWHVSYLLAFMLEVYTCGGAICPGKRRFFEPHGGLNA